MPSPPLSFSLSRSTSAGCALLLALGAASPLSSCLNRPVVPSDPTTSNQFVERVRNQGVDKIDLLFVIDNSRSMIDKQEILKAAVPNLLRRLVNPPCIDENGVREAALEGSETPCRDGFRREFSPIEDIHIGVITSSLGSHGGAECRPATGSYNDDRGLLLPSVRPELTSWNGSGFLVWDPRAKHDPPGYGAGQVDALITNFQAMVDAVRDNGCGYESTLEAWYRFLVDPEPPLEVDLKASLAGVAVGVDEEVLRQRKNFLRPDSLLSIVMLSDEDDCSVRDGQFGWMMSTREYPRPRGTAACAEDPLSPCCRACTTLEDAPPAGCLPLGSDPVCQVSPEYQYPDKVNDPPDDHRNLRCFDQKRRYGMEFLYPTSRYVQALTEPLVPNRAGQLVPNPIFAGTKEIAPRHPSLVLLAGIVGVPWQDVAAEGSWNGPGLDYLNAKELHTEGRWSIFLGDPKNPDPSRRAPSDPLMRPSPDPRSGTHPLLGWPLAPETSLNPTENPINGHEYVNLDDSDLQYACTFPLAMPLECTGVACDCSTLDNPRNRPLCQPPGGGAAGPLQYFAKAYPGPRHLEVLAGIGDSAVVASICPKETSLAPSDPSYGYNPALEALTRTFIERLERCLPRELSVGSTGELPCKIAEARRDAVCDCGSVPGRSAPSEELARAVRDELVQSEQCGGKTNRACSDFCICQIDQATGPALDACQNEETPQGVEPGYCYIDAAHLDGAGQPSPIGNPDLVANCPPGNPRKLRFVGQDTPQNGAVTFIACTGAPVVAP